jgi:hypothetical protein
MRIDIHHFLHHKGEDEILAKLDKLAVQQTLLRKLITMNQAELVVALEANKATLVKVGAEIDAFKASAAADTAALQTAIAGLEAELAAAGAVSPAATALVADITALSLALDGKIADLPVTPA